MRIRFLAPWGPYNIGDCISVDYARGANLCFAKYAEEVPDDSPVKVAAVDAPPRDKMLKRNRPHLKTPPKHKRGRPKGSKNKKPKLEQAVPASLDIGRTDRTPVGVMSYNENQNV